MLRQIATPVWQAASDIPPVIWWNNLERILLAVDGLGCGELWRDAPSVPADATVEQFLPIERLAA